MRSAELSDIPHLPRIERAAGTIYQDYLVDLGLTREFFERVTPLDYLYGAHHHGRLWVAELDNGILVGFALVAIRGESAHIDELNVLPEYTRRGIGSALVRTVCIWASSVALSSVTVSTFKNIPWNAPFYQRLGFQVVEPQTLSSAHAELVDLETRRGLHQAPRVIMSHILETLHSS